MRRDPVDLERFASQIQVRNLRIDDADAYEAVSLACYPDMPPWTRRHLASQLEIFPEGQFGVELDGRLVAVAHSLVVDFDEYSDNHSWNEICDVGYLRNHDPAGDTLYGAEIMVHPEFRGMRLARRLYDARKELCQRLNLKRIAFGGRIPGYHAYQHEMSPQEYVRAVQLKTLSDPVLTTQTANGFTVKRVVRGYLEEDLESVGYATLMEWANLDYRPVGRRSLLASHPVRICVVQYQMRPISCWEDFAHQCEYFVDVASGYQADFCLFPELLTNQLLSFMHEKDPALAVRRVAQYTPQYLDLFADLAVRYNINIVGGTHYTLEGEDLYNIAYLFQRSGHIDRQYKLHVTPDERLWWGVQGGQEVQVFDTDRGRVAIQICYDVEFPEVSRLAVEAGARLLFVPFCTAERQGYLRVRTCAQARCIENQVYTAIAGTVGNLPFAENMDIQYAQSGIFTPSDFEFSRDGIAAECTPNIETVVIKDVDLELLERHRVRGSVQNWRDRRLDLYRVEGRARVADRSRQEEDPGPPVITSPS